MTYKLFQIFFIKMMNTVEVLGRVSTPEWTDAPDDIKKENLSKLLTL